MAENEIVLETKLVGDIEGNFFIPSYQRGYRWDTEVIRLLDDVYANKENNYCLQPIVVKKKNDVYEVVDGQQRLTTLYLIYQFMSKENSFFPKPKFSITYETRKNSAQFLQNINSEEAEKYIDYWFIAKAYRNIENWFRQDLQMRVMKMFEYLKQNVKIIWYEVLDNTDAIALFSRLNIGKIPLTSSELVKAMFLSRASNIDKERQDEISLQWDEIERELHNDAFWYFLTNDTKQSYSTRIDLVLDLIAGENANSRDVYATFFAFDKMLHEDKKTWQEVWQEIVQTFLVLKDWFEDHELYHKIGYLIASDVRSLYKIFNSSRNLTKDQFKDFLNKDIKNSVILSQKSYIDLSYENQTDCKSISRLLLLFNVESVRCIDDCAQRFPFDKFKYHNKQKVMWSLEHIHAQHSKIPQDEKLWKDWLSLQLPSVKTVAADNIKLIEEIEQALALPHISRSKFEDLQQIICNVLSVDQSVEYLHSIFNLALLNMADNAALNNSTFDVKRNEIIKMDKKGQYIPFCTKMVFLKYYSASNETQLHFWTDADRKAYVKEICSVLSPYLQEAEIIGGEVL